MPESFDPGLRRPDLVATLLVTSARYKTWPNGVQTFEVRAEGNLVPEQRQTVDGGLDVSLHFNLSVDDYCPRVGTGLNIILNW